MVLGLLRDTGTSRGFYGLELVRESGGKLKRGTVYVILSRLEDKGFVAWHVPDEAAHAGLPRRRYTLTGLGKRVLEAVALVRAAGQEAFA